MNNEIIDTAELAEMNGAEEIDHDMVATTEPQKEGISFHVEMRRWTLEGIEELIIEAAARQLVGRQGESKLTKLIEARALALITEKADAVLSRVANDVLGHTVTKDAYSKGEPVTIGQMLSMLGRDYLTQVVDRDGKVSTSSYDYGRESRIAKIVGAAVEKKFAAEIETETNKTIKEVRDAIKRQHEILLGAEKNRVLKAVLEQVKP